MGIALLRKLAEEVLGSEYASRLWRRIELIGDIAVIRKPIDVDIDLDRMKILGEELVKRFKYIKSVWMAVSPVRDSYRVREYVHLAGEYRSRTVYKEHGCSFHVDIREVYVSPVLSYDHMRVAKLVKNGEKVLNMFAGFGGYSIVISRHAKPSYVLSIDINPKAARYIRINIELNKVSTFNEVIEGDALTVVEGLREEFDRVLLPLPELVFKSVEKALNIVVDGGVIHPHIFIEANSRKEAFQKASQTLLNHIANNKAVGKILGGHVIRSVAPRKYHVTLDIEIRKQ